jgi:hypothetical protein
MLYARSSFRRVLHTSRTLRCVGFAATRVRRDNTMRRSRNHLSERYRPNSTGAVAHEAPTHSQRTRMYGAPGQPGDWAEESRLPMLLTVCIEAGRSTLTHTSWTELALGSRKWMSGQAAALAAAQDRRPFANSTAAHSLRDTTLPSASRPPSPLDFYYHGCPRISPL